MTEPVPPPSFLERLRRLSRPARPELALLAGLVALIALNGARLVLRGRALDAQAELASLEAVSEEARQNLADLSSLRDLRRRDLERFKNTLGGLTKSRRALYEGGLQLQEEKRHLEKLWEIMTTYLLIDEETKKVHLMRGDQALESHPIGYTPVQLFGEGTKPPLPAAAITSKERFAHPERPKAEQVDGQLQWEPPQVGTSARANALGEFVIFTRGSLILHGPPAKAEEHAAFPHACAGLSLPVARRLYGHTYLGTKVAIRPAPPPAQPAAQEKK